MTIIGEIGMKNKIINYLILIFIVTFFVIITICGLKDCKIEDYEFTQSMDNNIWRNNFKIIK